ncbi:MAG: 16S rRNA (adenine(1518)-N(6)/adenine(1519)-N(6))-dimethyltransferase RsmA [Candidatus Saccharimonadales bacterium]|jgi:16S rRNA (adenine1518-N6/adenine1519-N6)-dimethyltransferase
MATAKKSLGQHWLTDVEALEAITEFAELQPSDTVLEIGPGLGSLTHRLVKQARHVIAVELDEELAAALPNRVPARNLQVVQANIMHFDLGNLLAGYKVVANIPYYLTSNLLRRLSESLNPPKLMVLLVQKEVAQRICARPGQMSLLAVSIQLYYRVELGIVVPRKLFNPAPKVDSRVVVLKRHAKPLFNTLDTKRFFRLVKAGFSARRKKLRSSLSAGLHISKEEVDNLLKKAGIDGNLRAQNLKLQDWHSIYNKAIAQKII